MSALEISLLENDILSDDQSAGCHLLQRRQHPIDMLIGIHEGDDNWKLASNIHQVARLHAMAAQKSCNGMCRSRRVYPFEPQVTQQFQVQWLVLPRVRFVQIDRDLYRHSVRHFTAPLPGSCLRAPQEGTADYSQRSSKPSAS